MPGPSRHAVPRPAPRRRLGAALTTGLGVLGLSLGAVYLTLPDPDSPDDDAPTAVAQLVATPGPDLPSPSRSWDLDGTTSPSTAPTASVAPSTASPATAPPSGPAQPAPAPTETPAAEPEPQTETATERAGTSPAARPQAAGPGITAEMPAEIRAAGLTNPAALRPSDSVVVTEDGAMITDLDVDGSITVQADGVTIRNVRVRSNTNSFGINIAKGRHGTLIENVEVQVGTGGDTANGAIGGLGDHAGAAGKQPGDNVTVRNSRLSGIADGIKVANYSLYEYNHIAMRRGEGSDKHIDGIQASGRSHWVARYNWVDQAYSGGHNAAIFAQSYTGSSDTEISGITIERNWVNGGVYTIQTGDGKDGASGFLSDVVIRDNIFFRDYLYGAFLPRGDVSGNGGFWADSGEPVPIGRIP